MGKFLPIFPYLTEKTNEKGNQYGKKYGKVLPTE